MSTATPKVIKIGSESIEIHPDATNFIIKKGITDNGVLKVTQEKGHVNTDKGIETIKKSAGEIAKTSEDNTNKQTAVVKLKKKQDFYIIIFYFVSPEGEVHYTNIYARKNDEKGFTDIMNLKGNIYSWLNDNDYSGDGPYPVFDPKDSEEQIEILKPYKRPTANYSEELKRLQNTLQTHYQRIVTYIGTHINDKTDTEGAYNTLRIHCKRFIKLLNDIREKNKQNSSSIASLGKPKDKGQILYSVQIIDFDGKYEYDFFFPPFNLEDNKTFLDDLNYYDSQVTKILDKIQPVEVINSFMRNTKQNTVYFINRIGDMRNKFSNILNELLFNASIEDEKRLDEKLRDFDIKKDKWTQEFTEMINDYEKPQNKEKYTDGGNYINNAIKDLVDFFNDQTLEIRNKFKNDTSEIKLINRQKGLLEVHSLDTAGVKPNKHIELLGNHYMNFFSAMNVLYNCHHMNEFLRQSVSYDNNNAEKKDFYKVVPFEEKYKTISGLRDKSQINLLNIDMKKDIGYSNFLFLVDEFMHVFNKIRYHPLIYKLNGVNKDNFKLIFINTPEFMYRSDAKVPENNLKLANIKSDEDIFAGGGGGNIEDDHILPHDLDYTNTIDDQAEKDNEEYGKKYIDLYEVYQNSKPSDYKDNLDYLAQMLDKDTGANKEENDKKTKEYAEKLEEDEKLFSNVEESVKKANEMAVISMQHEIERMNNNNDALLKRIEMREKFNNNMLTHYETELDNYNNKMNEIQRLLNENKSHIGDENITEFKTFLDKATHNNKMLLTQLSAINTRAHHTNAASKRDIESIATMNNAKKTLLNTREDLRQREIEAKKSYNKSTEDGKKLNELFSNVINDNYEIINDKTIDELRTIFDIKEATIKSQRLTDFIEKLKDKAVDAETVEEIKSQFEIERKSREQSDKKFIGLKEAYDEKAKQLKKAEYEKAVAEAKATELIKDKERRGRKRGASDNPTVKVEGDHQAESKNEVKGEVKGVDQGEVKGDGDGKDDGKGKGKNEDQDEVKGVVKTPNKNTTWSNLKNRLFKQDGGKKMYGTVKGVNNYNLKRIKKAYLNMVYKDPDVFCNFVSSLEMTVITEHSKRLIKHLRYYTSTTMVTQNGDNYKERYYFLQDPKKLKDKKFMKVNVFHFMGVIFDNYTDFFSKKGDSGMFVKMRFFSTMMRNIISEFVHVKKLIHLFEYQHPKFIKRIDYFIDDVVKDNFLSYIKFRSDDIHNYNARFNIFVNRVTENMMGSMNNVSGKLNTIRFIYSNIDYNNTLLVKYNDDDRKYYDEVEQAKQNTNNESSHYHPIIKYTISNEVKAFEMDDNSYNLDLSGNENKGNRQYSLQDEITYMIRDQLKTYPTRLFYTHKNTGNLVFPKYDHNYMFGKFTKIFNPSLQNREVAEQMDDIVRRLLQHNPVFVLGYGASGAGKTSSLIYFKKGTDESKNGILIHVCNILAKKGFTNIELCSEEYYDTQHYDQNGNEIKKSPVPTVVRVPFDHSLKGVIKHEIGKKLNASTKPYVLNFEYKNNDFLFTHVGDDTNKDTYIHPNLHLYRIVKQSEPIQVQSGGQQNLGQQITNKITEELKASTTNQKQLFKRSNKTKVLASALQELVEQRKNRTVTEQNSSDKEVIVSEKSDDQQQIIPETEQEPEVNYDPPFESTDEFDTKSTLAQVMIHLVDTDRLVKATTNNVNSSRSHTLVYVKLKRKMSNLRDIINNPEYLRNTTMEERLRDQMYLRNHSDNDHEETLNLIIGDFAGVENKFTCGTNETLMNFQTIKSERDPGKNFYYESANEVAGVYDNGEGGYVIQQTGGNNITMTNAGFNNLGYTDGEVKQLLPVLNTKDSITFEVDQLQQTLETSLNFTNWNLHHDKFTKYFKGLDQNGIINFLNSTEYYDRNKIQENIATFIGKLEDDERNKVSAGNFAYEIYLKQRLRDGKIKYIDMKTIRKAKYNDMGNNTLLQNDYHSNLDDKDDSAYKNSGKHNVLAILSDTITSRWEDIKTKVVEADKKIQEMEAGKQKIANNIITAANETNDMLQTLQTMINNYNEKDREYTSLVNRTQKTNRKEQQWWVTSLEGTPGVTDIRIFQPNRTKQNLTKPNFDKDRHTIIERYKSIQQDLTGYIDIKDKLVREIERQTVYDKLNSIYIEAKDEVDSVSEQVRRKIDEATNTETEAKDSLKTFLENIMTLIDNGSRNANDGLHKMDTNAKEGYTAPYLDPTTTMVVYKKYVTFNKTALFGYINDFIKKLENGNHLQQYKNKTLQQSFDDLEIALTKTWDNQTTKTKLLPVYTMDGQTLAGNKIVGDIWGSTDKNAYNDTNDNEPEEGSVGIPLLRLLKIRDGIKGNKKRTQIWKITKYETELTDKLEAYKNELENNADIDNNQQVQDAILNIQSDYGNINLKGTLTLGNFQNTYFKHLATDKFNTHSEKTRLIQGMIDPTTRKSDNFPKIKYSEFDESYTSAITENQIDIKNIKVSLDNTETKFNELLTGYDIKKKNDEQFADATSRYYNFELDQKGKAKIIELNKQEGMLNNMIELQTKIKEQEWDLIKNIEAHNTLITDRNNAEDKLQRSFTKDSDLFQLSPNKILSIRVENHIACIQGLLVELLWRARFRHLYIKQICLNRGREGEFINKSLADMRDTFSDILEVKNESCIDMVPSFVDVCMKSYCPKYENCFRKSETLPDYSYIKSGFIQAIKDKTMPGTDNIKKFYRELQICAFCVVNITVDKTASNPPPSPYIDINELKKLFLTERNTIFGNPDDLVFKYDENTTQVLTYTKTKPPYEEIRTKFKHECEKLLDIIERKYSNGDRKTFITYIQQSDEFKAFKDFVKIRLEQVFEDTRTELYNQVKDVKNAIQMSKLPNYLADLQRFLDYIDNINATSTIGTLEFMDKMVKYNQVNVVCKIPDETNVLDLKMVDLKNAIRMQEEAMKQKALE